MARQETSPFKIPQPKAYKWEMTEEEVNECREKFVAMIPFEKLEVLREVPKDWINGTDSANIAFDNKGQLGLFAGERYNQLVSVKLPVVVPHNMFHVFTPIPLPPRMQEQAKLLEKIEDDCTSVTAIIKQLDKRCKSVSHAAFNWPPILNYLQSDEKRPERRSRFKEWIELDPIDLREKATVAHGSLRVLQEYVRLEDYRRYRY